MREQAKVRIAVRKYPGKNVATFRSFPALAVIGKHFAVTPLCLDGKPIEWSYTVTHRPTGFAAIENLGSVRQAELVAHILSALPINWATVTPRDCRRRFKIDPTWIAWAGRFNNPEAAAEAAASRRLKAKSQRLKAGAA